VPRKATEALFHLFAPENAKMVEKELFVVFD
jgi:hypothetical protein